MLVLSAKFEWGEGTCKSVEKENVEAGLLGWYNTMNCKIDLRGIQVLTWSPVNL